LWLSHSGAFDACDLRLLLLTVLPDSTDMASCRRSPVQLGCLHCSLLPLLHPLHRRIPPNQVEPGVRHAPAPFPRLHLLALLSVRSVARDAACGQRLPDSRRQLEAGSGSRCPAQTGAPAQAKTGEDDSAETTPGVERRSQSSISETSSAFSGLALQDGGAGSSVSEGSSASEQSETEAESVEPAQVSMDVAASPKGAKDDNGSLEEDPQPKQDEQSSQGTGSDNGSSKSGQSK